MLLVIFGILAAGVLAWEQAHFPMLEPSANLEKPTELDTSSARVIVFDQLKAGTGVTTKIDLSAPENADYLAWLTERYTAEPNFERSKGIWDSVEEKEDSEGRKAWYTYDWNDDWTLELYDSRLSHVQERILSARSKNSDEAVTIEYFQTEDINNAYNLIVASVVDETSLLYYLDINTSHSPMHLYTMGKGVTTLDSNGNASFADEAHSILSWDDIDFNESGVWWSGALGKTMVFADLSKLLAGERDAVWKARGKTLGFMHRDVYPEENRLEVVGRGFPDQKNWDGNYYLAICDIPSGKMLYTAVLPPMPGTDDWGMWTGGGLYGTLVKIDRNTYYYFETSLSHTPGKTTATYSDNNNWVEKPIEQVVFYEIKCELA